MAQLIYLDLLSTTRYGSTTPVLHETRTGLPYNPNDPARRQERGNCNTLEDFSLQGLQGRASEGGAAAHVLWACQKSWIVKQEDAG